MNTEELMIGNYVLRHTGEITKVLEVLTNSVRVKVKDYKAIKSMTIPSKSINPITLTEEHLIKLGFKKFGKSDYYNKKVIIHKRRRGFVINTRTPIMEFVHQLQNYYYLHTKEKLIYDFTESK